MDDPNSGTRRSEGKRPPRRWSVVQGAVFGAAFGAGWGLFGKVLGPGPSDSTGTAEFLGVLTGSAIGLAAVCALVVWLRNRVVFRR